MSTPQGMRTVLRIKQRQQERLDEALDAARSELARQEQEEHRLQSKLMNHQRQEQVALDTLLAKMSDPAGVQPENIVLLKHLLAAREQERVNADKTHRTQQERVRQAELAKQQAQQAVLQGQERLKIVQDKLDELLRNLALAQEDRQEEEFEESAVARMLSLRRAHARGEPHA